MIPIIKIVDKNKSINISSYEQWFSCEMYFKERTHNILLGDPFPHHFGGKSVRGVFF